MFSPSVELSGKKNKRKKEKRKLIPFPALELNESCEDVNEGKKKKKSKSNMIFADMPQAAVTNVVEGKKKKDKGNKDDSFSLGLNGTSELEEFQKKKKKDKDGKKRKSSIGAHLDGGLDMSVEESPRKKKKKSKKEGENAVPEDVKSEEEEQERSFSKSPQKRTVGHSENYKKENSILSSGKKSPGKVKVESASSANDDRNLDSMWSVEEELALIDGLLGKLGPKQHKVPYRSSLRKVNWGEVAIHNRSPQECSEMLEILISKITKCKSLGTVLQEARELVSDGSSRLKKLLSPKLRFIVEYTKKHKSESTATEIRAEASAAWVDLSRKEKKRYELEYQQEYQKYREILDLPPEAPRNPFTIFYEAQIDKGGAKGMELKTKCGKKFNSMSMKDKGKYVLESCEEFGKYVKAYKDYKAAHPDWDGAMVKISPRSVFEEYLEYIDMPKCPSNVMGLFSAEMKEKGKLDNIDSSKKLSTLNAMYRELPEATKQKYKGKLQSLMEAHARDFKSWYSNANEGVKQVVETYILKDPSKKITFKNVVNVSMAKPKFSDEPEKPLASAFKIFSIKFEKRRKDKYKSAKELKEACELAWKALPGESKAKYEERYKEIKVAYKENILEFVRNLGDVAKVYLGFKRTEFFHYFKEDIFEREFPNEIYPVYELPKKEVVSFASLMKVPKVEDTKSSVKLSQGGNSEEGDTDSNDEDSSEEEDDESVQISAPSVKQLGKSPVKETYNGDEDDDDDDDDDDDEDEDEDEEEEVLPSWHTPKRLSQNVDHEMDSVDEDEDESSDDDDD